MITHMNHVSFTVSNLENSIEFYKNVLGLELIDVCERHKEFAQKVTGIEGAYLKIAYLKTSNCSIELIEYISPPGKRIDTRTCNIGSAHVCFNVDSFEQMVNRLKEHNVHFAGEPAIIPAGPNKGKNVLYFEDPDSNTVEFISNQLTEEEKDFNQEKPL